MARSSTTSNKAPGQISKPQSAGHQKIIFFKTLNFSIFFIIYYYFFFVQVETLQLENGQGMGGCKQNFNSRSDSLRFFLCSSRR